MLSHYPKRTRTSAAIIALLTQSALSHAAGFSLYTEGNGSAVGNFAAGIAAEAADASTGWYNPAGLMLLKDQQAVLGGVGVLPSLTMTGSTTFTSMALPDAPYTQSFSNLQGADSALVPSFHYAKPINDKWAMGLSVLAPFGLSTQWSSTGPIRYFATLSELKTITIAPEIATKLSDTFSIGAGLDIQYADVSFNRVIGNPAVGVVAENDPYLFDSTSQNEGNSWGLGFHAGVLAHFNSDHTRLGVNYQSSVQHKFKGSSTLNGPLGNNGFDFLEHGAPIPPEIYKTNNLYTDPVNLPAILTLSGYQDVNEKWAVLGSVVYSFWGSMQQLTLNNVAAGTVRPDDFVITTLPLDATSHLGYKNAWRFALGANYKVSDKWMMRFGGGYDQTPTVDAYRDPRAPEMDRWALSVGSHYQVKKHIGLDVGYTYLFKAKDGVNNKTDNVYNPLTGNLSYTNSINATSNASASLLGAQLVWKFDEVSA